jgi:hypothetical protein
MEPNLKGQPTVPKAVNAHSYPSLIQAGNPQTRDPCNMDLSSRNLSTYEILTSIRPDIQTAHGPIRSTLVQFDECDADGFSSVYFVGYVNHFTREKYCVRYRLRDGVPVYDARFVTYLQTRD